MTFREMLMEESIIDNLVKKIGNSIGYDVKIEKGIFQDIWDGIKTGTNAAVFLEKTKREIINKLNDGKDLSDKEKDVLITNIKTLINSLRSNDGVELSDTLKLSEIVKKEAKKLNYNF